MACSLDYNDDDSLELASKTWNRAISSVSKVGYSDGAEDGSVSVFQDGFDKGYKDAFKASFIIGVLKGLQNSLDKDKKYPEEIENLLSKTKRGICYLCEVEDNDSIDLAEKSITEIKDCQKRHAEKSLKILKDHFDPILKENKINLDVLKFYTEL